MSAATAKGPLVFLDYDQAGLVDAYNQAKYGPNMDAVVAGYATDSDAARTRIGEPQRLSYGPTAIEAVDIYRTRRPNAPIHIYIHGGGWRQLTSRNYAFAAETFVKAGAHFVVADFIGVEHTDGRIQTLVDQVRRAVAFVYRNAETFGGDRSRIHVTGHSSGGHLTSMVLVTDWQKEFDLPADIIKTALCCSGIYDLLPTSLVPRPYKVQFDSETIEELSAIRHLDRLTSDLLVAYGTNEPPEFPRHARDFAAAAQRLGKRARLIKVPDKNHFEILHELQRPDGILARAVLEKMQLTAR
jgi:arylformamidase